MIPNQISLEEGIELTTRFREDPGADMPLCETFEKDSVVALLSHPDSRFFRIYLGRKEDDSIHSVLVAADADGKDILPPPSGSEATNRSGDDEDDGILLENALHCPPVCPPPSPLNG